MFNDYLQAQEDTNALSEKLAQFSPFTSPAIIADLLEKTSEGMNKDRRIAFLEFVQAIVRRMLARETSNQL